jgi:hypothetical protein
MMVSIIYLKQATDRVIVYYYYSVMSRVKTEDVFWATGP